MEPELFQDSTGDNLAISANDNGDGENIIIGIEQTAHDSEFDIAESLVIALDAQQATAFAHLLLQLVAGI